MENQNRCAPRTSSAPTIVRDVLASLSLAQPATVNDRSICRAVGVADAYAVVPLNESPAPVCPVVQVAPLSVAGRA
jgi:hypothetical protein